MKSDRPLRPVFSFTADVHSDQVVALHGSAGRHSAASARKSASSASAAGSTVPVATCHQSMASPTVWILSRTASQNASPPPTPSSSNLPDTCS